MAAAFTAGTPLGSQFQYTPITFAPLLSLVPQRPAVAPEAPMPTGLEATAQMPAQMPAPMPYGMDNREAMATTGGQFQNPQTGIMSGPGPADRGVNLTVADLIGRGANVFSAMSNPLSFLAGYAMTGRTIGDTIKGALTPVETAQFSMPSEAALSLAEQAGMSPAYAQGLINAMGGADAVAGQDLGAVAAQALGFDTGMGTSYGAVGGDGGGGGGGMDTGSYGGDYGGMFGGVDGI